MINVDDSVVKSLVIEDVFFYKETNKKPTSWQFWKRFLFSKMYLYGRLEDLNCCVIEYKCCSIRCISDI
ncbi:17_t:CDS:2 [Funneliformis geosporum]|nr:17_t:CDS:2 [Funneliformis geosporum]